MQLHAPSLSALVLGLVFSTAASAQTFEYRWGGLVYEITVPDATHAWTVEDGGRIRRTSDSGLTWRFDVTPLPAHHRLRGIYVLPDLSKGWAVGEDGMILHNIDPENDDCWAEMTLDEDQVPADAEFYDVFFADKDDGWLLAEKGFWYTTDAGVNWNDVNLLDDMGDPVNYVADKIELYAMDIKPGLCQHLCGCIGIGCSCPLTPNFGLACGEPGFVYRTTDGITWREVWDITDLTCASLGPCAEDELEDCGMGGDYEFEPWDIEISDHATDPLAIMVGGAGVNCGLIFASDDWGCSWTREPHNCEVNPGTCEGGGGTDDGWIEDYPPENLESYRTVYGVAIDPTDNSAIAAAYNGQHLRRVPGDPGTYWTDHSLFGDVWKTPYLGTVVFPMIGAEFTPTGSLGYITGFGGHVRTTTDGMTYTEEGSNPGDYRIRGADFVSDVRGTLTGQYNMLAETLDGGEQWEPRTYKIYEPRLNAVAFAGNGLRGVAVGQKKAGEPIVKYTINGGTTWFDATLPSTAKKHLNSVAWDKGTDNKTFWAVGNGGLILETVDGGENWTKITGPSGTGTFKIYSVAFGSGPTRAAIVGTKNPNITEARAYTYIPSPPTWTDATPSSTPGVTVLTGVDAIGGEAYAVGTQVISSVVTGIVLKLDMSTKFEKLTGAPVVPLCTVGKNPSQTEPLNAVGLLSIVGDHQVLVAGQCGVVYELASTTWTQHRSETSSHIRGIRVAPGLGRVYLLAFRNDNSQSCIVREHIE